MNYWYKISGALIVTGILFSGCGSTELPQETIVNAEDLVKVTEAYGSVVSKEVENIAIEIPAKVVDVVAKNGQEVLYGDVLFTLDMTEFNNQLADSENTLRMRTLELEAMEGEAGDVSRIEDSTAILLEAEKSELARLEKRYSDLKNKIENGSAERLIQIDNLIETSQTTWENASNELEGSTTLYENGVIAGAEYEAMVTKEAMAYDALANAKLDYEMQKNALKDELGGLYYQMEVSRSRVEKLEVDMGTSSAGYGLKAMEVSTLKNNYDLMVEKTLAPYMFEGGNVACHVDKGIFYNFNLSAGDYIAGTPGVLTYSIAKSDDLEIRTTISEDFIKDVTLGAPVKIRPIAAREKVYNGTVTYIADMAEKINGDSVILVYVSIDDNDGFLKPNYSVDMEIEE